MTVMVPRVEVGDLVRIKRGPNRGNVGVITGLHHNPTLHINPYVSLNDGRQYTLTNIELLNRRNGSKA